MNYIYIYSDVFFIPDQWRQPIKKHDRNLIGRLIKAIEGSNRIGHPECFVSFDDRMNISHKLDIIFYPEYRLEFTQRLYEGTGFATEHKKDPFVNLQCSLK